MLNSLRKQLTTLLAAALLTPGLLSAAVQPLDRIAVIVNDDIIMQSQVQESIDDAIRNLKARNQPMPPKKALIQQVVERLIMESLQLQVAERGGIRVDDTSLNEAISRIAAQNNMTLEQFRQAIIAEGSDYAATRESIRRELLTTRARQGSVGPRIQITDQEIRSFLDSAEGQDMLKSKYQLAHILISDSDTAEKQANALYEQLQGGADFGELAKQHSAATTAAQGGNMGWRDESQLPSLFKDAVKQLEVGEVAQPIASSNGYHLVKLIEKQGGDSKIEDQTQVRHILIQPNEIRSERQAEEMIYDLFTRIQSGEDFAELARLFSADPGSRAKGGDMGWVTTTGLVPSFVKTMEETQVDAISAPFKSRFGWHILEVTDRRQQDVGAEASRQQAREILYRRKFNDEMELWLREIRNDAFVDIKI